MGSRITKADLERAIEHLNAISKHKYGLSYTCGKARLVRFINDEDTKEGVVDITIPLPKRLLYYTIHSIINYVREERA